jgi:hypothetical protein
VKDVPRAEFRLYCGSVAASLGRLFSYNGRKGGILMKILFLHGWTSKPGGVKPTYLARHGHIVLNPALPDEDFPTAVLIAQSEFDRHQPDAVVGSSRGGAVAMNIDSSDSALVLLCPAWKRWGTARTVKKQTTILHSRADDVIPFAESEELVCRSGLPASALIEVGTDHRLADPEPLAAMLNACERAGSKGTEELNDGSRIVIKRPARESVKVISREKSSPTSVTLTADAHDLSLDHGPAVGLNLAQVTSAVATNRKEIETGQDNDS